MNNPSAFIPSGQNSHFGFGDLPYPQYCQQLANIIKTCRIDLHCANQDTIVEANCPREYLPKHFSGEHAALLVHGLFDCPYTMHAIGEYLQNQGILARSILLPGHGTRPADLLTTRYQDWLAAVQYGYDSLKPIAKSISLVGLSTGASCAIALAQQGLAIDSLIAIVPALKLKSSLRHCLPLLHTLSRKHYLSPWFSKQIEQDYTKYSSISYNAVWQLHQLIKLIQQQAHRPLNQRLLFILTAEDEIINNHAALQFLNQAHYSGNALYLYSRRPQKINYKNAKIVSSQFPQDNVLDLAHCGLSFPVADPHYGYHGDYRDFHHYQSPLMRAISSPQKSDVYFGAINFKNLFRKCLARATFNPDFLQMANALSTFIQQDLDFDA